MGLMEFQSALAEKRYADLVDDAALAVIGLDFDGVLSPIVPEPAEAHIHPQGADTLVALAGQVKAIAVITGRPARQAVALGTLDEVGNRIAEHGHDLLVLGQYGNERWSAKDRRVLSPLPPKGLATFMLELPDLLRAHGLAEAHLEEKGLAVAVHTRRMADPVGALQELEPLLRIKAAEHGLVLEPGRMVIEVRAPGMNKGEAVRRLQKELRADAFMFIGDDLGDIEAFRAVMDLRKRGMLGLLVCSASLEQPALAELADVTVGGPDGVMELLNEFTEAAARRTVGS
jgi:trehalose 6-phosphate phosphatase